MERKTLEQFQDERAQQFSYMTYSGYVNYKDFNHFGVLNLRCETIKIELESLRLFHEQEMKYMQSQIDLLKSILGPEFSKIKKR